MTSVWICIASWFGLNAGLVGLRWYATRQNDPDIRAPFGRNVPVTVDGPTRQKSSTVCSRRKCDCLDHSRLLSPVGAACVGEFRQWRVPRLQRVKPCRKLSIATQ
jgi:hypothetical protein